MIHGDAWPERPAAAVSMIDGITAINQFLPKFFNAELAPIPHNGRNFLAHRELNQRRNGFKAEYFKPPNGAGIHTLYVLWSNSD